MKNLNAEFTQRFEREARAIATVPSEANDQRAGDMINRTAGLKK